MKLIISMKMTLDKLLLKQSIIFRLFQIGAFLNINKPVILILNQKRASLPSNKSWGVITALTLMNGMLPDMSKERAIRLMNTEIAPQALTSAFDAQTHPPRLFSSSCRIQGMHRELIGSADTDY